MAADEEEESGPAETKKWKLISFDTIVISESFDDHGNLSGLGSCNNFENVTCDNREGLERLYNGGPICPPKGGPICPPNIGSQVDPLRRY